MNVAGPLCAVVTAIVAGGPAMAQLPCSYTVTVLPDVNCGILGSAPGNPSAINNLGHAVVWGACSLSGYADSWLWTGGTNLALIPKAPGMLGFHAADINDNDVIVGEAEMSGTGRRAAIYDHGTWTILPPLNPPMGWSSANAINNNNQVCGYRSIGNPNEPVNPFTAFRWSQAEGFTDLGLYQGLSTIGRDLNASGSMVVGLGPQGVNGSLFWTGSSIIELSPVPGYSVALGTRINGQDQIAGSMTLTTTSPWTSQPFIWTSGVTVLLGTLPGYDTAGVGGFTSDGVVTGRCGKTTDSADVRAYLWRDGVLSDLSALVTGLGGVVVGTPRAITEDGRILTTARVANENKTIILVPHSALAGDTNCDQHVDVNDLLQVITHWGPCGTCPSDLDSNGVVNVSDLLTVITNWGNSW
jgi:hypothetical protein